MIMTNTRNRGGYTRRREKFDKAVGSGVGNGVGLKEVAYCGWLLPPSVKTTQSREHSMTNDNFKS
jgi:hypothetical protein